MYICPWKVTLSSVFHEFSQIRYCLVSKTFIPKAKQTVYNICCLRESIPRSLSVKKNRIESNEWNEKRNQIKLYFNKNLRNEFLRTKSNFLCQWSFRWFHDRWSTPEIAILVCVWLSFVDEPSKGVGFLPDMTFNCSRQRLADRQTYIFFSSRSPNFQLKSVNFT